MDYWIAWIFLPRINLLDTLSYGRQHYNTRRVYPFVYTWAQIAPEIIAVSEKTIFFSRGRSSQSKMWARGRALSSCDKWSTGCLFHGSKGSRFSSRSLFARPRTTWIAFGPSCGCVGLRECDRSGSRISCLHFSQSFLARRTNLPVKYHGPRMY